MKRIYILLLLGLLIGTLAFPNSKVVLPYQDDANFTNPSKPTLLGYHLREFTVPQEGVYSGLKLEFQFSTPDKGKLEDVEIFELGAIYGTSIVYFGGLSVRLKDNNIVVFRQVKLGNTTKTYSYKLWEDNIFDYSQNYILSVEIDETRIRFTLSQNSLENVVKIDYQFYGLANSYLRDLLSGRAQPNYYFNAIMIDKRLAISKFTISDLSDKGVAVQNVQTSPIQYGTLKNMNSNLVIMPENGSTSDLANLYQDNLENSITGVWEMKPVFQGSRKSTDYKVELRNIYSNKYMVVKDASTADKVPVVFWQQPSPNSTWNVKKNSSDAAYFTLKNNQTNGYAVVADALTTPKANVVQWHAGETSNSFWKFENYNLTDNNVKTGYYYIKLRGADMYIEQSLSQDRLIRAYSKSPLCLFYVEKQPTGLFTITSLSNEKMWVSPWAHKGSFYPRIVLISLTDAGLLGNLQWKISRSTACSSGYTISSAVLNERITVSEDQTVKISETSTVDCFEFIDATKEVTNDISSGYFKIKHVNSNKYVVIKDASTEYGGELVLYSTADTSNSWFRFVQEKSGLYQIVGAQSNRALGVKETSSMISPIVQHNYPENSTNFDKWFITKESDGYKILSMLNGLYFSNYMGGVADLTPLFTYGTMSYYRLEPVNLNTGTTRSIQSNWDEDWRYEIIPNISDQGDDETAKSVDNKLDMKDEMAKVVKVYPSPVIDVFTIQSQQSIKMVRLYSMSGAIVRTMDANSSRCQMDIRDLDNGVYSIEVVMKDNTISRCKIVKQ